mgnify:CR=1 FL=1
MHIVMGLPTEVYVDHLFTFPIHEKEPGRCSSWARSQALRPKKRSFCWQKFVVTGSDGPRSLVRGARAMTS